MSEQYPTDASIRLAEEFREKAKQSVVKSFSFDVDNDVKGTVVITDDSMGHVYNVYVRFVLNGKEYVGTRNMPSKIFKGYDNTNAINDLREEMGKAIQEALNPQMIQAIEISLNKKR